MYAAFIDFRKAFDSVKRETLLNVLQKNGINGKMVTMIKSIYNIVLSCVRCPYGKTIFFDCPNGVKQGCILSPILFSLLVQEITNEIHRRGGYVGYNFLLTWLRLVFCCLRTTSYLLLKVYLNCRIN